MTRRERVRTAFAHSTPDCTPCDYYATPEIHDALLAHFGLTGAGKAERQGLRPMGGPGDNVLPERLGTDIRYVAPPYIGPPLETFDDGSTKDMWGVRRRPMPNEFGEYAEPVTAPYAGWETAAQAAAFPWPSPDWFDYGAMPAICARYPDLAIAAGSFSVQDFINGVAFGRGVEQVLMDIALEDPVFLYIVERRHRFYMEHIERILRAARGRIDLVLCGDDFGTQRAPLISAATFERLFAAKKRELFALVHSFGAKVTHNCCGSSRALIPQFLACGMDALQTVQRQAAGMDPYDLKREYAGRLVLHGDVDVQGWLQRASVPEIEQEVDRLMDEVGRDGGFVLGPCHHFQPDTPTENVLAVYRTVARRRGRCLWNRPPGTAFRGTFVCHHSRCARPRCVNAIDRSCAQGCDGRGPARCGTAHLSAVPETRPKPASRILRSGRMRPQHGPAGGRPLLAASIAAFQLAHATTDLADSGGQSGSIFDGRRCTKARHLSLLRQSPRDM